MLGKRPGILGLLFEGLALHDFRRAHARHVQRSPATIDEGSDTGHGPTRDLWKLFTLVKTSVAERVATVAGVFALSASLRAPSARGDDQAEEIPGSGAETSVRVVAWHFILVLAAGDKECAEGGAGGHDDADLSGHDVPVDFPSGVETCFMAQP